MTAQVVNQDLLREFLEVEYIWQIQKAILEKYSNVKIAFIVFDTNNDKYIFPDELSDRLLKKGISEEIDKHMVFFNFMDDDEDGRISFTDWTFGFKKVGRKIHETRNKLLEANQLQQSYSHLPADLHPSRENQQSTPSRGRGMQRTDPLVEQYVRYSPTRSADSPSKVSYIRMSPLVGARRYSPPHNEDLVKHMTHVPHDMANYSYSPIKAQRSPVRLLEPQSPERMSFGPPKQTQIYNFLPTSNEKQRNLVQKLYQGSQPNSGRIHSPYGSENYDPRSRSSPIQNFGTQSFERPIKEVSQNRSEVGSDVVEFSENGLPKIRGAEFGYPEPNIGNTLESPYTSMQDSYQIFQSPNPNIKNYREISTKSTGIPSRDATVRLSDGRRDNQAKDRLSGFDTYSKVPQLGGQKSDPNRSENKVPSRYTTPEKYSETVSKQIDEPVEITHESSNATNKQQTKSPSRRNETDSGSVEEDETKIKSNQMMQIEEEERESEFSQRGPTSSLRTPVNKTNKTLGSQDKSPHPSSELGSGKKNGANTSNQIPQETHEENIIQNLHQDSPAKLIPNNCAMKLEPEIIDKPQDSKIFYKMEKAKSKALRPYSSDENIDIKIIKQKIKPSPVKSSQSQSRTASPTKNLNLNESEHQSDRNERRSAGESLNSIEFKKTLSPEKTISDKILSSDNLFKLDEHQDLQETKKLYSELSQLKSSSSRSKYDRFVILEERTNESSSPYSQKKEDLRRLSSEMRRSARSFETDKPENNERSLIYGKDSPIKGGFTFPHEEKVKPMSIHELKQNLGDANCKSLRNFSTFLDSLSTFKLKTDNKKIPKKDTLRIAKTALSTYLLDHPDLSKSLINQREEHKATASYLDFSGSSKLYLISEFTRLEMVSRQLKNANQTLKFNYPEVKLPSDKKTFLKR